MAIVLRRMATSNGVTPFYLLAPEVSALLHYMPDRKHHFLFSTLWNTGARIGEACSLQPESFVLDGPRPFVRILSEKVRSRRGRPPKDAVRLVPLTDRSYVHQVLSWMATERPKRREPLWSISLWNTVYMERAIDALKRKGLKISEQLLSHLSPLGWEHINLTGDFIWKSNRIPAYVKFRRLRPAKVERSKNNLNVQ